MAAAIIVGVLVGLIGFAPYPVVIGKTRKMPSQDGMGYLKWLLVTFAISFAVLVAALVIASKVAHDVAMPFAVAMILTFVVAVIVYGLISRKQR